MPTESALQTAANLVVFTPSNAGGRVCVPQAGVGGRYTREADANEAMGSLITALETHGRVVDAQRVVRCERRDRDAERLLHWQLMLCGEDLAGDETEGVAGQRRWRIVQRLACAIEPATCETCGCADACGWKLSGQVDPDVVPCASCGCCWCGPPTLDFLSRKTAHEHQPVDEPVAAPAEAPADAPAARGDADLRYRFLVLRKRDAEPFEVWPFREKLDAEEHFDRAGERWTETYLCNILRGPRDTSAGAEQDVPLDTVSTKSQLLDTVRTALFALEQLHELPPAKTEDEQVARAFKVSGLLVRARRVLRRALGQDRPPTVDMCDSCKAREAEYGGLCAECDAARAAQAARSKVAAPAVLSPEDVAVTEVRLHGSSFHLGREVGGWWQIPLGARTDAAKAEALGALRRAVARIIHGDRALCITPTTLIAVDRTVLDGADLCVGPTTERCRIRLGARSDRNRDSALADVRRFIADLLERDRAARVQEAA